MSTTQAEAAVGNLLTVQEAAALLKCSVSALNKWRIVGLGPPFVRIASCVRYRERDIAEYLAGQLRVSTSATNPPEAPAA
jgi:hypothetical protein